MVNFEKLYDTIFKTFIIKILTSSFILIFEFDFKIYLILEIKLKFSSDVNLEIMFEIFKANS